jgi:integrase
VASAYIGNDLLKKVGANSEVQYYRDTEIAGFALKIMPNGSKTYILQCRLGRGRLAPQRTFKIGSHGTWTPQKAREEAKRFKQLAEAGIDPQSEQKERTRERVTLEFSSYADRFIDQYLTEHWAGSLDMATRMLRKHVVPVWKGRSLKEIKRSDVASLMEALRGKAGVRRNSFAVLRKMFRWAVNNGDLEASPIADMDAPAAPPSRDRVLSNSELANVWKAAEDLGHPYSHVVRLLILTGQRRNEVAGMKWDELSREAALWIVPGARAKNSVTTEMPLSPPAVAILDRVYRTVKGLNDDTEIKAWPKTGLVFTTTGKTPVSGHSRAKGRLDRLILKALRKEAKELGSDPEEVRLEDWRFHDLRRTLATGLQRFGVSREVTEAVLNHVSGSISGIARVYQRHDYKAEKRAALDHWARHVEEIAAIDTAAG